MVILASLLGALNVIALVNSAMAGNTRSAMISLLGLLGMALLAYDITTRRPKKPTE
jgi:hypothetical protein